MAEVEDTTRYPATVLTRTYNVLQAEAALANVNVERHVNKKGVSGTATTEDPSSAAAATLPAGWAEVSTEEKIMAGHVWRESIHLRGTVTLDFIFPP